MKVLLVGAGNWGSKLADRFAKIIGMDSIALCDLDEYKLNHTLAHPLTVGRDYQAMLSMVDACIIATPPKTHYEIAKMCLEAGKHVLVEKPMTLHVDEAKELIAIAQAKKLTLMTDDTFLYGSPFIPFIYHRIFASVFEAHWTGPRLPDPSTPKEGILWTLGPHPVSIMLKAMSRYPLEVEADIKPRWARLIYQFTGGDEATIVLNWDTPVRERSVFTRIGFRTTLLDLSITRNPEPLMEMCKAFIARAGGTCWIDTHALRVVEALHMAEESCAR